MTERPDSRGERLEIRPARPGDDEVLAGIIRAGMAEFGICGGAGPGADPEIDRVAEAFGGPGAAYFVVERDGRVEGGGGIGPLEGAPDDVCELRKMYFLPPLRGRGAGWRVLELCLEAAGARGYRRCCLATLTGMQRARRLYEAAGFVPREGPLGDPGHAGCDRWYEREL